MFLSEGGSLFAVHGSPAVGGKARIGFFLLPCPDI
jgi:hypothetical protein